MPSASRSRRFSAPGAAVEAALDHVHDLLDLEGLEHVVVGAALHRLDGRLDGAEAGHDHRQHLVVRAADGLEQLQAAHARHLEVGDHDVVAAPRQLHQRALAVRHRVHQVAFERQEVAQDLADRPLVVDHQDPRSGLGRRYGHDAAIDQRHLGGAFLRDGGAVGATVGYCEMLLGHFAGNHKGPVPRGSTARLPEVFEKCEKSGGCTADSRQLRELLHDLERRERTHSARSAHFAAGAGAAAGGGASGAVAWSYCPLRFFHSEVARSNFSLLRSAEMRASSKLRTRLS